MNNRVARVSMFVTPTNPRFIDRAWTRGGDVYILDIEDSIAPAEKERCRTLIRESIEKASKGGASIYVRINKPFVDADLPVRGVARSEPDHAAQDGIGRRNAARA